LETWVPSARNFDLPTKVLVYALVAHTSSPFYEIVGAGFKPAPTPSGYVDFTLLLFSIFAMTDNFY